jgi:hypothetical protein
MYSYGVEACYRSFLYSISDLTTFIDTMLSGECLLPLSKYRQETKKASPKNNAPNAMQPPKPTVFLCIHHSHLFHQTSILISPSAIMLFHPRALRFRLLNLLLLRSWCLLGVSSFLFLNCRLASLNLSLFSCYHICIAVNPHLISSKR